MNDVKFTDETGKEVLCNILSMYNSEKTKKNYIIYTDKSKDENNKQNVYASELIEEDNEAILKDIIDEDDEEAIKKIIDYL